MEQKVRERGQHGGRADLKSARSEQAMRRKKKVEFRLFYPNHVLREKCKIITPLRFMCVSN